MGEMADYTIQCDDEVQLKNDHTCMWKTCRVCGKEYLFWLKTERGWRLFEQIDEATKKEHCCYKE